MSRYVRALVVALRETPGIDLQLYRNLAPRLIGPHLLMPLRMRLGGVDLIHGPANGLPLLRLGLPGVVTIHDLAIYQHPEWFPRGQSLSTQILVPRSARGARAVICPSEATRRQVVPTLRVPAERCHVIPHGVEAEFALPAADAVRAEVRRTLGLPDRYLLQVGTVQPRKNYVTSLRALARIPKSDRIPLIVAGSFGWGYEPVVRAVQELDLNRWVRFVGYVGMRQLPALYQMSAAVLFPSLDEGFGLPVLEAFAAGAPVLASDAGAIPEAAGDAAILCRPTDDAAIAERLITLLRDNDLREKLIAAGRARAALYTWVRSARAHADVYRSAAA